MLTEEASSSLNSDISQNKTPWKCDRCPTACSFEALSHWISNVGSVDGCCVSQLSFSLHWGCLKRREREQGTWRWPDARLPVSFRSAKPISFIYPSLPITTPIHLGSLGSRIGKRQTSKSLMLNGDVSHWRTSIVRSLTVPQWQSEHALFETMLYRLPWVYSSQW